MSERAVLGVFTAAVCLSVSAEVGQRGRAAPARAPLAGWNQGNVFNRGTYFQFRSMTDTFADIFPTYIVDAGDSKICVFFLDTFSRNLQHINMLLL